MPSVETVMNDTEKTLLGLEVLYKYQVFGKGLAPSW